MVSVNTASTMPVDYLEVTCATTPEVELQGRAIIDRLRAEYPAGEFYCICDCYNTSLTKEGAEIWVNFDQVKILFPDSNIVIFRSDTCPVCRKKLPTADGGSRSNVMRII